jgi:hypothetical protein
MAATFCSGFNSARTSSSFNSARNVRRRPCGRRSKPRCANLRAQFLHDRGGLRADVVAQNDAAQQIAFGNPDLGDFGAPTSGTAFRSGFACPPKLKLELQHVRGSGGRRSISHSRPSRDNSCRAALPQALAGDGFKMVELERLKFFAVCRGA